MILTEDNLHGLKRRPICEGNLIAHISANIYAPPPPYDSPKIEHLVLVELLARDGYKNV